MYGDVMDNDQQNARRCKYNGEMQVTDIENGNESAVE